MTDQQQDAAGQPEKTDVQQKKKASFRTHAVRFREGQPSYCAGSRITNLQAGELVMVPTDHGLEPATIVGPAPLPVFDPEQPPATTFSIARRANRDEKAKFDLLLRREREAFDFCRQQIEKHRLIMKLISVERFFNGSKIIFYFTAENRVDFRELVKVLVQEFRTRVEMRQIGVRHETKMLGGVGCCGRELCCSSFMKNFAPVSIKMAKAQELPLNPAKISGLCNRLLCCLTYEYETYHQARRDMPRVNKRMTLEGTTFKIIQVNPLARTITVLPPDAPHDTRVLAEEQWRRATFEKPKQPRKKSRKK